MFPYYQCDRLTYGPPDHGSEGKFYSSTMSDLLYLHSDIKEFFVLVLYVNVTSLK